ncbi:hypothetical protein Leryth_023701 [Lithospermum erythrorhizon]|nr:hypothetical protein Leryth_023701 [Lithospermum erythrorhizon]
MSQTTASATTIRPADYSHSPVHYAVAVGDHAALTRVISSLRKQAVANDVQTEADSLKQENIAEEIARTLDRRDNPSHETPLHLAVRLNDAFAVKALANAGADISLQNSSGWNSLQEAVIRRCPDIVSILVQHHHSSAWSKWRHRLPRLVAALRRMRDFYMEISFHFESSIVPFVGKIAPSDTYKIWKLDGNLRADTSLAGYDGLKIQRANQSFLFYGDGDEDDEIAPGSLLVLNHDDKKIFDAFESAGTPLGDLDVANFCKQTSIYRPGMDVTKATLVGRTNWRGQEKTETIGSWKSKVYEVQNVVFSFRSRKIDSGDNFIPGSEQILPLELAEDSEEGFLVAENPRFSSVSESRNSCSSNRYQRHRHSSFVREESQREYVAVTRKSVDIIPERRGRVPPRAAAIAVAPPPQTKDKEYVKNLKPSIWLTEHFPLKTEELMPLLDILANKVKAVRRMRELLTTTFPPATFPVKVAIPVVPTVRVVITFTKFVELQSTDKFYTPLSSPRHFSDGDDGATETEFFSLSSSSSSSSSSLSSMSKSGSRRGKQQPRNCKGSNGVQQGMDDPFVIPAGYSWSSFDDKSKEMKKSKSTSRRNK